MADSMAQAHGKKANAFRVSVAVFWRRSVAITSDCIVLGVAALSTSSEAKAAAVVMDGAGTRAVVESTKSQTVDIQAGAAPAAQLGYQAFEAKRYADALSYFDEAIKADPSPATLSLRGRIHIALGQNDAAINDFTRALSQQPRLVDTRLARAVVYTNTRRPALAINDYDLVLAVNPVLPRAYIGRGIAFHDLQEPAKAATDFVRAAKLESVTDKAVAVDHYRLAALTFAEARRTDDAIACASAALALAPDDSKLYALRGDIEKTQDDKGKALVDYETAIRLNPGDTDARQSLAGLLEDMGQYQASLDQFNEIFREPRNDPDLYLDHANLMMDMARDEDADRDYERAEKLRPAYPRLVHQRMQLRFYRGDYAAAVRDADWWLSTKGKSDSETNVAYTLLWRHISMQRQGIDDKPYMIAATKGLKTRTTWPYPLIQYLIGRLDERQLRQAALRGTPEQRGQRQCEAAAYIGERRLSQNQPRLAEAEFRRALAVCPFGFIERSLAVHELQGMAARDNEYVNEGDSSALEKRRTTPAN